MILEGRAISPGRAEGEVLLIEEDFSFLGGVDPASGELRVGPGGNVRGRVLAFPRGKGSTVGSYTIFDLASRGLGPAAVINSSAETIVTTGAVISGIPLVDKVDISVLRSGDLAAVDGDAGTVELRGVGLREVVTGVVQRGTEVLIMRRSDEVSYFPGMWGGVSGRIEEGESPKQAAIRELEEETGLDAALLREGEPFLVRGGDTIWRVHPLLFSAEGEPRINWEHSEHRWIPPSALPEDSVPRLDEVLRRLGL